MNIACKNTFYVMTYWYILFSLFYRYPINSLSILRITIGIDVCIKSIYQNLPPCYATDSSSTYIIFTVWSMNPWLVTVYFPLLPSGQCRMSKSIWQWGVSITIAIYAFAMVHFETSNIDYCIWKKSAPNCDGSTALHRHPLSLTPPTGTEQQRAGGTRHVKAPPHTQSHSGVTQTAC